MTGKVAVFAGDGNPLQLGSVSPCFALRAGAGALGTSETWGGTVHAVPPFMRKESRPGAGRRNDELLGSREGLHRYALWLTHRGRDLVSAEDAVSAADLAMVRAWRRYAPGAGQTFRAYARPWVRGALLKELREAVTRGRRERQGLEAEGCPSGLDVESEIGRRMRAVGLLDRLTPDLGDLVVAHVVNGESLAAYARAHGRHRAWACRRLRRALETLREAAPPVRGGAQGGLRPRDG